MIFTNEKNTSINRNKENIYLFMLYMIIISDNYNFSILDGLFAFICCLVISLVPVFLLIYTTVVVQRYYHELEKEKIQPTNIDRMKRRFAIVPSILDENDEIRDQKFSILAKDIPNEAIGARNLRLVSV